MTPTGSRTEWPLNHPADDNNTNTSHNAHISAAAVLLDLYMPVQYSSAATDFSHECNNNQ